MSPKICLVPSYSFWLALVLAGPGTKEQAWRNPSAMLTWHCRNALQALGRASRAHNC